MKITILISKQSTLFQKIFKKIVFQYINCGTLEDQRHHYYFNCQTQKSNRNILKEKI